jgi:4-hydroxybenzoate polyprenyltransferase
MGKLADLVRLARPRHWAKNAFVLLPVPFGLAAGGQLQIASFAMGLLGFSLANSAAYAFNDAQDAEQDRAHPEKRRRPVAAGRIRPGVARAWSVLLLAAAFALVGLTGNTTALVILVVYVLLNAVYSLIGKDVALLDVFILSTGFVLRVLLGCALIDVAPSNWLLLCSSALALFLSLAKRRADLARGLGSEHRPSLAGYSVAFLDQAIGISAAMTLIAYGLYCMEGEVGVRLAAIRAVRRVGLPAGGAAVGPRRQPGRPDPLVAGAARLRRRLGRGDRVEPRVDLGGRRVAPEQRGLDKPSALRPADGSARGGRSFLPRRAGSRGGGWFREPRRL